ncbi:MAG TPA: substrate-binding domain-containing protein [Polyangia bacterium]|jgi:tungstate transport system substrate-binding protein
MRPAVIALLCLAAADGCRRAPPAARPLILATTTSTQDSSLLDALLPAFERAQGIQVKVVAVGTGEALAMGARGDADVLLVHARAAEDDFMRRGLGARRLDVMHNDFVLVGPPQDPAAAKGTDAAQALRRIAAAGATFASRGDRSGTHVKEQELWRLAGVAAEGRPWHLSTGQGMAETARLASEKRAYALVDRATWLATRGTLDLGVVVAGDPRLFNPYGVIVVDPARFRRVNGPAAQAFARFLVAPATQRLIADFGVARYGEPLFVPDAR